ncbi:MAG: MFS transporter, partial [Anaerolineales bacterium]|nr:MFS transporter [Anaerolineales bacterium]
METSSKSEKTLEPTDAEKIRRIPWVLAGNAANMTYVHLTFMGSVFILFLSELGLSKTQIGTMLSLIPFFGVTALFIAPVVARAGNKKIFIIFHAARKLVTICLLFTPLVLEKYGPQVVLWYIAAVVAGFALFRAISLTARYPWSQEFVPNTVRGKFSAAGQIVNGVVVFIAVTASGYYLGPSPDTRRFVLIFAVGTLAGLVSVWANLFVPGGAPIKDTDSDQSSYQGLFTALKDRNLRTYMAGDGLVIIASAALNSFVPLYMSEAVGLNSGNVVLLQSVVLIGGLITSFLWGWAADRYGSKPITISGVFLKAMLPILLFIIPRYSHWSLPAAAAVSFWQGFAGMGWSIGSARMLYVSIVPQIKRMTYMAVYFAFIGIIEGSSQLFSGRLLDSAGAVHGQLLGFTIDRYSILFLGGLLLPLFGVLMYRRVCADSKVSVARFAGMFLRGNPLLAMESLIGYQLAKDETAVVSATERLGRAKSPLTVDELEETLSDPRFNVRFEAIVSIAHHGADPRLTEALVKTLQGSDPALSTL